ncbi:hypothetical protein AS361_07355 [Myroides marinus]|uniref:hypothetical protein n=1 Tax=Myroides marinus TaxID=703342 RepID=UPI00074221D8|nr:hypothetical protein [Myroides marinus]KUF45443.1 hypothetical protein AS361_07355 [Myroides marinus]
MKSTHSLWCLFFFLIYLSSIAQQSTDVLHGRIITREGSREGIVVTNKTKGNSVLSDKIGYFDINSQVNDTLKFTSPFHIEYTYVVTELDMKRNPVLFPLEQLYEVNQLNEIVITKYSGGSLGLFEGIGKKYTPAERKLRTATTGSLDLLVNALNGRTSVLKKNLEYEREGSRVEKFLDAVDNSRLVTYFKIPSDYTESFVYYAVTKAEVKDMLNRSPMDPGALEKIITPIVFEFLEMIKEQPATTVSPLNG